MRRNKKTIDESLKYSCLSRLLSPMAERPGSTGAKVSYASEVVVFRPNAISLTLMPGEGAVLNLAASCEEERAEWADAIERASKFNVRLEELFNTMFHCMFKIPFFYQGCVVEPESARPAYSKETVVVAPCLVALTATSVLVFNFSGSVVTNCNLIFLDDIVDIVAKGAQLSRLVMVRNTALRKKLLLNP